MSKFDAAKFVADMWITGADLDQGNVSLEAVAGVASSAYQAGLRRAAEIMRTYANGNHEDLARAAAIEAEIKDTP